MTRRHVFNMAGDVTLTRRDCLGVMGTVTSLGGCSTSPGNRTGTKSGKLYKQGENLYTTSPNIKILSVETTNSGPNAGVFGVVENVGDHVLDMVQANAFFYDEDGNELDTGVARRTQLHPSNEWRFEAPLVEGGDRFSDFRLIVLVSSS